jgi:two-component system, NtrC family, sensor kinase
MVASIAVSLAGAVWFSTSEQQAALDDFSHEQALLAAAVGVDFEDRLARHIVLHGPGQIDESTMIDDVVLDLLAGARRLERPGELTIMVARPGQRGFLTTDRRVIPSARIRAAIDQGASTVEVPREEAPTFGLPRRRAIAGLSRVAARDRGPWGIVVLASVERLRDRQKSDDWRLVSTVVIATAIVAALGGIARRRMRRALDLERAVAVSQAAREREAALAQADKMATIAALSTGIAHEVGTPLAVIVGRVEQVLGRASTDERSTAALRIVLEQVERIQRIMKGSLALARGDAPHLVPTSPASVAGRAVDLVRHRFRQAEVELVANVGEPLPDIACDPSLFEQALVNVLLNACQATRAGGHVSLDVRAEDGRVLFVVDDDGVGIPDAVAARASDPFFSTKRAEGGSGLGLTIAREIVKHHGGDLEVARRQGLPGTRAKIAIGI